MSKSEERKKELLQKLQGMQFLDGDEMDAYNKQSKDDAIKYLEGGMSPIDLYHEMVEQGWDDASPVYKIVEETATKEDDGTVKTTKTTTIGGDDADDTKAYFKKLSSRFAGDNDIYTKGGYKR